VSLHTVGKLCIRLTSSVWLAAPWAFQCDVYSGTDPEGTAGVRVGWGKRFEALRPRCQRG